MTYHTRELDITDLKLKFDRQFNQDECHDAYRFMMHLLNIVTLETVDKYTILGKSLDIQKYFKAGVCNQSFGILSNIEFECSEEHITKSQQVSLFLNLKQTDDEDDLQALIDEEFEERKALAYCNQCQDKVEGFVTKEAVTLPKTLIVTVDRYDENGALKKLISDFSSKIEIEDKNYLLSGMISQDPVFLDYNVSLKDDDSDYWTCFSKRGISKYTRETSSNV
jgi:uncharacterized UBP type Zn finger protein